MQGTSGSSQLNDAGIAKLKAEKKINLDLSSGKLQKSSVGLDNSATAPDLVAGTGGKFDLRITAPNGVLEAKTDHVRFTSTDTMATIPVIYYFLPAQSFDELKGLIYSGVESYGMDAAAASQWIASVEADPKQKTSFALGQGNKLGLGVEYEINYDGAKSVQVITVTVSTEL